MRDLIVAETIKMSRAKSVKVCVIVYFVYVVVLALIGDAMNPERNYGYMAPINEFFANSSLRITVLAIIVSVNICLEYQNGMLNNIISVGVSRIRYFMAKLITLSVFVVLFNLMALAVGMLVETIRFGFGAEKIWFEHYFAKIGIYIIFSILLDLIGVFLCSLVSYVTKNTIVTIVFFYAYTYIGFLLDKHSETFINKAINLTSVYRESYYIYFKKDLLLTSEYFTMHIPCLIFGFVCLGIAYMIFRYSDIKVG